MSKINGFVRNGKINNITTTHAIWLKNTCASVGIKFNRADQ